MLAEFRDYLKTLDVADYYYIGKLDNSKTKAVGVYSMPNMARVESIGLESSYDVAGVRVLLHWNKNAKESEQSARNLYEKIRYITDIDMAVTGSQDSVHVQYVDLDDGEPTFLGTDENGVYEYHISMMIYYKRKG